MDKKHLDEKDKSHICCNISCLHRTLVCISSQVVFRKYFCKP